MQITHCEPSPAHYTLRTESQFYKRHAAIVSKAHFDQDGSAISDNRVDFADIQTMQTHTHTLSQGRRSSAPFWALNDAVLRRVLVTFWTRRAIRGGSRRLAFGSVVGERQSLAAAQAAHEADIPNLFARLDELCREYVSADPGRRVKLRIQIANLDSRIRIIRRGPGLALAVTHMYFRLGFSSVDVARELHLRPTCVRQILHRLGIVAARLSSESERETSKRKAATTKVAA